jgi:hypothetical protein
MATSDDAVLAHISELVDQEHDLQSRSREGEGLSEDDSRRLRRVEEQLDQCWDLLRQRRARRHAGQDPDEAHVRDVDTVEHYRQ